MKGYKGFGKGLICKGKQYAENTVFEEESAEICKSGMHFCANPFDVLDYYGFVDSNENLNEFAEVEALDEVKTDDGKKYTTTKLKIGGKIGISGLVNAFVEFVLEKTNKEIAATNTGNWSAATNTGDRSAATNTGYRSAARVEGVGSVAIVTGYQSKAKASIGSAIVICERGEWNGSSYPLLSIKSAIIDGKRYKPDTWYTVKNGRIVEANN